MMNMNTMKTEKKSKLAVVFIGIAAVSSLISQSVLDFFSILSLILVLWVSLENKLFKQLFKKIGIEWALVGFFMTCVIGILWHTGGVHWPSLKYIVKLNWMLHLYLLIAA